jgi:VWFA-related protein
VRLGSLLLNLGSLALLTTAHPIQAQQSAPPASSPAQQPAEPTPTIVSISRAVVLDIVVVDSKGHPVKGLKKSDFTLREDGAPQTLKSFEEHSSSTLSAANTAPKLPANTYTNYIAAPDNNASTVLLIDAEDTNIDAQMYLHEQLVEFMKHVPQGASMAIFVLDDRMHLVQGFTTDQQALLDAVNRKWANPHFGIYDGKNDADRHFRRDILKEGMQELGRYLSGFPGRKNLIWISDPSIITDAYRIDEIGPDRAPAAVGTGLAPPANKGAGVATRPASDASLEHGILTNEDPSNLIGNPFRDTASFQDDLSETADVLTLSRVAVYLVDARGLVTGPPQTGERVNLDNSYLDSVAEATGGKSYYNTNGLRNIVAEVVDIGSNYYTVSYTPTNNNWNGKFRHIKVELTSQNANLQYRNGYIARDREEQEQRHLASVKQNISEKFIPTAEIQSQNPPGVLIHRGPDHSLQASMTLGAIPSTELIFASSFTPSAKVEKIAKNAPLPPDNYLRPKFRAEPFRNYNLLYAIDMRKIGFRQKTDGTRQDELDFVAVVYDDQGTVVNSLITTVSLNLSSATYRRLARTGFSQSQRIAIPVKGKYFIRLGVRDSAGDRVGAMEIPVSEVKPGIAGVGQTLVP